MLEDLRKSASESHDNIEDEDLFLFDDDYSEEDEKESRSQNFLGMTPQQRFIVVLTLFFMTCILGGFCLLLTGKVVLF
ncbi:MAG: hypothetical protein MUO76_07320 [Anaerolineaceae bacterium]|jgi:hypothetical protein|nr:hypothetical protein [Anaerolineaceae bacterium]